MFNKLQKLKTVTKLMIALPIIFIVHCSIVIPPITFTGSKTAAEKQIIGEETELEEDVWMISSAKTTTEVDTEEAAEMTEKDMLEQENRFMYKAFSIMDTFRDDLAEFKRDKVVGENNQGELTVMLDQGVEIPEEIREKYKKESEDRDKERAYRMLYETVKQINIARDYIIKGYIMNQKRVNASFKPDIKELKNLQKEKYQKAALKGEFIQLENNSWVIK